MGGTSAGGQTGEDTSGEIVEKNGEIVEKNGEATRDTAKKVAGKEAGLIDGTDAVRPTTRIGAGRRTQPLGGSHRRTRPDPGPESPDPARKKAEDAGTSAPGAPRGVQDRAGES